MILNIHGFGGEGDNSKYKWLCKNAPCHEIYSPTFNYASEHPYNILEHLLNRIASYRRKTPDNPMGVYVVGNSLGGFFARRINQIYPSVPALLINPSLAPFLSLREYLSDSQCQDYLDLLARYAYDDDSGNREYLHVIIGDSDEVINHEILTKPLLPRRFKNLHSIAGGTHRLDMTPEVENIFRSVIQTPEGETDGDPRYIHHCGVKKLP